MAVKKELIEKFAVCYAVTTTNHALQWWGDKYGVATNTIKKWLNKTFVKEIISKESKSFNDFIIQKARRNATIAMRELKRIVKSDKLTDVKRKACNDMLGIAKIENINKDGRPVMDEPKSYKKMSNTELQKEYDALLGVTKRKKKTALIDAPPLSGPIN